jgi:hypothetical protein
MSLATLQRRLRRLQQCYQAPPAVPTLPPMSALELWQQAMGCEPDPWQAQVLKSDDPRLALLCCRQSGKSSVVAVKALHVALYEPKSLILLLSRSLRQSGELARKVFESYQTSGRTIPPESETKLSLELANGSRILALPGGDPEGLRGFSSPRLLCLDEAARIPDSLYISVRPMLAVAPKAAMILLSTPFGKRGFFYRVMTQSERWLKIKVTAEQCPRLSADFLAEELIELGPRWYAQEYTPLDFLEAIGQVFSDEAIDAAFHEGIVPLFGDDPDDEGTLADDLQPLFAE